MTRLFRPTSRSCVPRSKRVPARSAWRSMAHNQQPSYGRRIVAEAIGTALLLAAVIGSGIMVEKPLFFASQHVRHGNAQLLSEFIATFGLLSVIWGCVRMKSTAVPFAVGAYITAAYWFTASTSFANPAVTVARAASDTFAGIRLADVPGFVIVQLLGAACATALFRWHVPTLPAVADEVLVPHPSQRDEVEVER